MKRKNANFSLEKTIWQKGIKGVAGTDEVGRGAFAGPVMAGAVLFTKEIDFPVRINDSKELTSREREAANIWIRKNSIWGIGKSSVDTINKIGIVPATNRAFREAIKNIVNNFGVPVEALLIDAFYIPYVSGVRRKNQFPIVKGDKISASIAAASIIAKVERDHYMQELGSLVSFRAYNWEKNKGYGTKNHRESILHFGATIHHRIQYVETYLKKITQ